MDLHEKKFKIDSPELVEVLAYDNELLSLIDKKFQSVITVRGNTAIIRGEAREIRSVELVFKEMSYILKRNGELKIDDIHSIIGIIESEKASGKENTKIIDKQNIIYYGLKDTIRARTPKQLDYYKKVQTNDLVFAVGPAGTGKTFLAVAMALESLKENQVSKIIISRPAVEAGESLGFLPGDLTEKLDPYLRPLTDALYYMIGPDKLKSMFEKNIIEITPLAYMRGRTLNNAFIILDEAQNATITQMKMFLTRMGANSKAIVTGDITQIDLKEKANSGLVDAVQILKKIEGIKFVFFTKNDVVRHKLVAKIINAYERNEIIDN
jgi:phosphate starvation-inducible PhoH-like protein